MTGRAAAVLVQRLGDLGSVRSVTGPAQSPALSAAGGRVALVQASLRGDARNADSHVQSIEDTVAAVRRSHPGVRLQEVGAASEHQAINNLVGHDLGRAEKISLPVTLVILVLAFGALVAASVPLLLGLTSVAAALGALGLVSHLAPNSSSTSAVVALIGLAVGVDYSLFYVRREREERRNGLAEARTRRRRRIRGASGPDPARPAPMAQAGNGSALDAAAASVGRAVFVSGSTVVVALAGLLITGQGDFVSMGLGTILVVVIAVIGSITVLPAALALLGDRVDRGQVPGYRRLIARRARREAVAGHRVGFWAGTSRAVTAHPRSALTAALCLLGTLAVPLFGMHTGGLSISQLPHNLPVVQAAQAIGRAFPGTPEEAELVVSGSDLGSAEAHHALLALGQRALTLSGGRGQVTVAVSSGGDVARVDLPLPERRPAAAEEIVKHLRASVAPTAVEVPGAHGAALVTGTAASNLDYSSRMASTTPEVIGFVLALGFLLLLFTFRAPLLAAAVMLLNLISIGAAYGILTAIFEHTWAEGLLGFRSSGYLVDWLPLFMFVVLFGLSMDYTVLVLERICEARMTGAHPRQAAAEGVAATAGAVTSAAIVMVAVFAILGSLDVIDFRELGVGLAAAVLLDATLVRGVALPAVVTVLGERGWPVRRRGGVARRADRRHEAGGWDDVAMPPVPVVSVDRSGEEA